jgi:glycosyltransferase involved in cell wall biosynthesis
LESIAQQTVQDIEIIVVDNGSTDDTLAIAREFTDNVLQSGPERSAQVNYGVSESRGVFVYRVDSDFDLPPTIVAECLALCAERLMLW